MAEGLLGPCDARIGRGHWYDGARESRIDPRHTRPAHGRSRAAGRRRPLRGRSRARTPAARRLRPLGDGPRRHRRHRHVDAAAAARRRRRLDRRRPRRRAAPRHGEGARRLRPPAAGHATGCASSARRSSPCSPRPPTAGPRRRRARRSSTTTRCRPSSIPRTRSPTTRRVLFEAHGDNVALAIHRPGPARSLRRRRRRRPRPLREPAHGRRADGAARLRPPSPAPTAG